MDVVVWLWWALKAVVGVAWTIVWFLIGGWVVTLLQIVVIVGLVFGYKYGWTRAPAELSHRMAAAARVAWAWARRRERPVISAAGPERPRARANRQMGDINLSTLMSLAALLGLGTLFVV